MKSFIESAWIEGREELVNCPVQTFGLSLTAPYNDDMGPAIARLLAKLYRLADRLQATGWTVATKDWEVGDEDFLMNTSRIVGRIQAYIAPDNWAEVDEQVNKDTHGYYREMYR